MKQNVCPSCEKSFEGRRNKKFCSLTCKNQFHNEGYREQNKEVHTINKILNKNRTILKDLYKVYRSSAVTKSVMDAHGFNSKFHTHLFNASSGIKYTMIYEFGYRELFDEQIQIVELENSL